jgi:Holliday junction DNA helicase RuvB
MTWRPASLSEFFGQPRLLARLDVLIEAALAAGTPLPHLLLTGPPGSGRSSLVYALAERMNDVVHAMPMPVDLKELESLLRSEVGGIFLFTEFHEASRTAQARILTLLRMEHPWFTIVASTTEAQKVAAPLRSQFLAPAWEPYSPEDMLRIVSGLADRAGLVLDPATLDGISRAAAGTPRNGLRLIQAAQALALATYGVAPSLDDVLAQAGFALDGLTEDHLRYLDALDLLGRQASLPLLSLTLRLHPTVLSMEIEPLLRQVGYITHEGGARVLSPGGFQRLRIYRHGEEAA